MPFIWVNEPQIPQQQIIEVPGPDTTSYKVDVVANTVNAGGALVYDTSNSEYDVIYQINSMNANSVRIDAGFIEKMIVTGSATIDAATINIATFANVNANKIHTEIGISLTTPTINTQIATKEYVDVSVANVPTGGSELQNIIDAAGDLLVGISPNTATRLPIGTIGQILVADSTSNTGLNWRSISQSTSPESFSGVFLQTHYNRDTQNNRVILIRAAEIIMNSGQRTIGWANLICDISLSGAGGLDIGTKINSQWYEIYAARNSANNDRCLFFHKSTNISNDATFQPNTNSSIALLTTSNPNSKLAQSFKSANTGPLTSIELELSKVGLPDGLIWSTIETDSGNFPSGTILANSNFLLSSNLSDERGRVRFLFRTPTTITSNTTYHIVLYGNYINSDSNYVKLWGNTSTIYSNGNASEYRSSFGSWFKSSDLFNLQSSWFKVFVQNIQTSSIVLPTNYDEYCLLGYVYVNEDGNFKHMIQKDRKSTTSMYSDWVSHTTESSGVEVADVSATIPPRNGIGIFSIYRSHGTPYLPVSIGSLTATDIPIQTNTGKGFIISNTVGQVIGGSIPGERLEYFPPIIVEDQALSIRTQNSNCKLYVIGFEF